MRWEGIPEKDYCSDDCAEEDAVYEGMYDEDDDDDFDYTRFRGDW